MRQAPFSACHLSAGAATDHKRSWRIWERLVRSHCRCSLSDNISGVAVTSLHGAEHAHVAGSNSFE